MTLAQVTQPVSDEAGIYLQAWIHSLSRTGRNEAAQAVLTLCKKQFYLEQWCHFKVAI